MLKANTTDKRSFNIYRLTVLFIIDQNMVPELETLERYIAGELSSSEREALESMLQEDPMLADAIDGLKEVDDMEMVRTSLARLYRGNKDRLAGRARKREQMSKRKSRVVVMDNQPLFMGIAAGLVILIVSVFVIRNTNKVIEPNLDPAIAQNTNINNVPPALLTDSMNTEEEEEAVVPLPEKTKKKEEGPKLIADNIPPSRKEPVTASKPVVLSEKEMLEKPVAVVGSQPAGEVSDADTFDDLSLEEEVVSETFAEDEEALRVQKEEIVMPKATVSREKRMNTPAKSLDQAEERKTFLNRKAAGKKEKEIKIPDSLPVASDTMYIGPDLSEPPAISRTDSVYIGYYKKPEAYNQNKGRLLKAQAMTDLLFQGVEALRVKNLELARDKFEEVLASSPKNVTAHFYLGKTQLEAGNHKAAIKSFRHNLDYPAAPLYEENKWYLVQAYIKSGKTKAARRLLEEIIASKSPYRSQALNQLKDLE